MVKAEGEGEHYIMFMGQEGSRCQTKEKQQQEDLRDQGRGEERVSLRWDRSQLRSS